MRLKVIACRVFAPELEVLSGESNDELTIDYLPLRAHDKPEVLRADIQARIDDSRDFDAVILAYGLCGNAAASLRAGSIPLYIPRAHDCSHILLGGLDAHAAHFADTPSRGWTSRGYLAEESDPFRTVDSEFGWDMETLVKQYGEENARYVWETLHATADDDDPVLYFLDVPETRSPEVLAEAKNVAAARGKELRVIPATLDLLARLLGGRGGRDILAVPPGGVIRPTWDDSVLTSDDTTEKPA